MGGCSDYKGSPSKNLMMSHLYESIFPSSILLCAFDYDRNLKIDIGEVSSCAKL